MSLRRIESLGAVSLRQRGGRSVLTGLGIAFGVAVLFGVLVANGSIQRGLRREIDRFTGKADVNVSAIGDYSSGLAGPTADALRALPDVAETSSRLTVPATSDGTSSRVLGLDANEVDVSAVDLDKGRLPAEGADEVALDPDVRLASAGGPAAKAGDDRPPPIDSTVTFTTATGPHAAKVVGYLSPVTVRHLGIGVSAVTSLATAQRYTGVPGGVDFVRLVLKPGTDTTTWLDAHEHDVPGVTMRDAGKVDAGFTSFIATITSSLTLFALLALFMGGFLIYLTLSVSVVERTPTYGTLRALGATPRQVLRVVVAEAAALGAVATLGGLVLGTLIGLGLVAALGGLFGVRPAFTVPAGGFVAAIVLGMGTSILAASIPARRAAALSPVTAMRGNVVATTKASQAWIVGAVLVPLGVALGIGVRSPAGTGLSLLFLLGGAILLVPPLLAPLAAVVGRLTRRLARGVGAVTVMHLVRERARSAYTLALVMVVLATGLAIGIGRTSMNQALDRVLRQQFGADVNVLSPGVMTPEQVATIQAVPGVAVVSPLAYGQSRLVADNGIEQDVGLFIVDGNSYFDVQSFAWHDGNDDVARAAMVAGGSILVPTGTAEKYGLVRGTTVRMQTRAGVRIFAVAATFDEFGGSGDSVVIGRNDAAQFFGTTGPSGLVIKAQAGQRPHDVATRIRAAAKGGSGSSFRSRTLNVVDVAQTRAVAHGRLDGFLRLFEAVSLVAILVGLLGLANTLAMSVVQRFREIGMLRAVGAQTSQVRQMVVVESATLAAVAGILAVPLGLLMSYLMLRSAAKGLGFSVPWRLSLFDIPFLGVLTMAVALLAAIAPSRRAGRLTIVETLRND